MKEDILKLLYQNAEPSNGVNIVNENSAADDLALFFAIKCLKMQQIINDCVIGKGNKTVGYVMNELGFTLEETQMALGFIELENI